MKNELRTTVGTTVEVLVFAAEGKKDAATHRLTGRAEDGRLVHFTVAADDEQPRPGDVVTAEVTEAATFHLLADAGIQRLRRTRAGDAWDRSQADSCGVPATPGAETAGKGPVSLGIPLMRAR